MSTAFIASHKSVQFLFSFVSKHFLFLFLFYLLTHWMFKNVLFAFVNFSVFPLSLIFNFILLWSENTLCLISIFLALLRLKLSSHTQSILESVPVRSERACAVCWVELPRTSVR